MAQDTKLFLDGVGELDLGVNIPIALNFSLNEIQDITKRNSAFSKTIVLPGTKGNLEKLGFLFNVNVEFADATFEINRKVEAWVYQNGSVVLQGFFKLINVKKLSPSDISYEEQIEFEAVVFGGQASFFDYVKQYDINQVDLSIYDHILTWDVISGSTTNTYLNGYKYIWHYCIQDNYNVGDFRPSMFVRTIWDKIFIDAGYSYYMDTDFQTNVFNKLLIPTNARDLLITTDEQLARSAKIGIIDPITIYGNGNVGAGTYFNTNGPVNGGSGSSGGVTGFWGTRATNLLNNAFGGIGNAAFYEFDILEYNNDGDCYYNGSYTPFDTTNFQFVCQKNSTYDVIINLSGQFEIILNDDFSDQGLPPGYNIPPQFFVVVELIKYPPTGNLFDIVTSVSQIYYVNDYINFTSQPDGNLGLAAGTYNFDFNLNSQPLAVDLLVGERLKARVKIIYDYSTLVSINNPQFIIPAVNASIYGYGGLECNNDYSFFQIQSRKNTATEGDIFTLSSCLPQKIKMVDFIKAIATMFNLYIDIDPQDPYRLIIKPRSSYYDYSQNSVIDWTNKIDYSKEYSVELLSELQDRTLNFTYKASKDEVNTDYFEQTKFIYGQFKVNFDNDFLSSEEKIEVLFEPTPLVYNGDSGNLGDVEVDGKGWIVPYLVWGRESLPKILIDGGVINTDTTYVMSGNTTPNGTSVDINYYAYAGHFDNPYVPFYDLNWNINESYRYDEITCCLTENNLYNLYWGDYVNLISNSRLLTAYFNLNEADIKNLRFDVLYWIRDSYWLLNKVVDYNASLNTLTKCEFIKSINTPFFKSTFDKPDLVRPTNPIKPLKPWNYNQGKSDVRDNLQGGATGNQNNGLNSTIKGIKNIINKGTRNFSVLGNFNNVGENIITGSIIGNDNIIGGDARDVNVTGNRNIVGAGAQRVTLINCEDVTIPAGATDIFIQNVRSRTITKTDVAFVSPYVYFNQGYRVNNSDIVDGGLDIVFDPQNPFVDNVMDGLEDETFMMGVDGAQIIDGTYDSVDF